MRAAHTLFSPGPGVAGYLVPANLSALTNATGVNGSAATWCGPDAPLCANDSAAAERRYYSWCTSGRCVFEKEREREKEKQTGRNRETE